MTRAPADQSEATPGCSFVMSVGSNLHRLPSRDKGPTSVWGSGCYGGDEASAKTCLTKKMIEEADLTVAALRGPLSLDLVAAHCSTPLPSGEKVVPLGDPGMILPWLYQPRVSDRGRLAVLVVPHFSDAAFITNHLKHHSARVMQPGCPWRDLVDAMTSADLVLSSALHPLVVAEAYGVPAAWLRDPNLPTQQSSSSAEGTFKYHDYYLGTGRQLPISACDTVQTSGHAERGSGRNESDPRRWKSHIFGQRDR